MLGGVPLVAGGVEIGSAIALSRCVTKMAAKAAIFCL